MKRTFLTRENIKAGVSSIAREIGEGDLRQANFLRIQRGGQSQVEMLRLFDECLRENLSMTLDDCGRSSDLFVYVDDMICTGQRVVSDLDKWIAEEAPNGAKVLVISLICYSHAKEEVLKRLRKAALRYGKDIDYALMWVSQPQNSPSYAGSKRSEIFSPAFIPDNPIVQRALEFSAPERQLGHTPDMFSSEEGRHILEQELLLAGARIRSLVVDPKPSLRALGYGEFSLGFGATIVTYRNCPNNCPLAFWWGDPLSNRLSLNSWYPLFPRKTYSGSPNG